MAFWVSLLVYSFGFVVALWFIVFGIHWLLDRIFGKDTDHVGFAPKMQADFFQKAISAGRKSRESKFTPHYDAFVEAEWAAQRLADDEEEADFELEHSLADLLERNK